MTCNCCANLHKSTGLTAAGILSVTNSNNIGNFDPFCLLLTINPDSIITTAPVAYTVTVNDANVPLVDMWGYPVMTDRLRTRKVYRGRYIMSLVVRLMLPLLLLQHLHQLEVKDDK